MHMFLNCLAGAGFGWLMSSMGYSYTTPQFWISIGLQLVLITAGYLKD